jgi:hypothetical protein
VNLVLLQQALNRFKELVDGAITNGGYTNSNGDFVDRSRGRVYDGNTALTAMTRSEQHITPIHEVVKISISEQIRVPHLVYPEIGDVNAPISRNELKAPMYGGGSKNQDVTVIFTEEERGEYNVEDSLYWNSPFSERRELTAEQLEIARRCITIGVRSTIRSIGNNINTLSERNGAEPLLQRALIGMEESVKGEVFLVAAEEYDIESAEENQLSWTNHGAVEAYILNLLSLTNRPTFRTGEDYDWHNHVMYERVALIVVDFSQEPPLFYRNLRQMFDDELVTEEFYNQYHQGYDGELSPVNFAEDLVNSHSRQWPELYEE